MLYEEIRNQAFEANMKIPENHLALYTWGNVSAFDKKEGVFAIKPSAPATHYCAPCNTR